MLCSALLLAVCRQQGKYLAEAALLSADTNRLRVAAHTLLGRCCHALGDFQAAQFNYAQVGAVQLRHAVASGRDRGRVQAVCCNP